MSELSDPNVIYGGDIDESEDSIKNYASIGAQIVSDLGLGGDKTAFINGVTGVARTFNEILTNSTLMAKTMHAAGLKKDDVITIISENRHEFTSIAFGAFFLNAIIAPISTLYTEREFKHGLELAKPKFVFVTKSVAKRVSTVCKGLHYVKRVIVIDDDGAVGLGNSVITLKNLIKKFEGSSFNLTDHTSVKVNLEEQVAVILNSSGTTGLPKGVMITQKNMMCVMLSYRQLFAASRMLFDQVLISNIAPWFHALGFMSMYMVACAREVINVFLPRFEEEKFYQAIEKYKVNILTVVPPVMVLFAKSPLVDKYDLSSIQDIGCGAAALSKEIEDRVRERIGDHIMVRQGYGLSEATLGVLGSGFIPKPGSVGEALRGVYVKVIDENGKSVGPNVKGELCFKGDRIMKGYINNEKETSASIDKDGWLRTGDLGYYDEDKQFFIVDRLKELIKYKASQVAPAEIESVILTHEKVKDCGVIGIPDEKAGELPFAFVVKQPGAQLTDKEVIEFVQKNASKAKWIRGGVKFIDAIPKNPSGKILRREMKEMYKNMKSKL